MKLFKLEGYNLNISEEAYTLKPFKKIWDRDKTKKKEKAIQELAYIYFMEDPRSDYQMYIDREDRSTQVKEGEGIPQSWKADKEVIEAMSFYSKFKPASALLLEDTRVAVNKVRQQLRDIDLNDVDEKGRPIYTLDKVIAAIKQVPTLIRDLDEAERTIAKEITSSDKVRGTQTKSMYEDL